MKKLPAYDPAKIEKKWQKKWTSSKVYKSAETVGKDKFYVLDMFPYPSGEGLHVGHPKGYIATDVVSRLKRMQGKNVLHPMGFDAFGLPAENYALKTKTNPADSVAKNVARYKKQLELLGFDYDWSREVNTTDPAFYKWTQWIFLQLWKKGLAYESNEPINWCPSCKTGLANEDVDDGRCERCGTPVEKKPLRQWVLKITDYAERLLTDLDMKVGDKPVLDWPESIKESQRNWIGRSEGVEIDFRLTLTHRKPRFVIIHGYKGGPKEDFLPWLKVELEKQGHEVEVPELPNPAEPKEAEQVEYILKNCKLDENTVIIGHSLGAIVAMKALVKFDRPISGLTLVAAAFDAKSTPQEKPYHPTFDWTFDYERIKKLTNGRIAVVSDIREENRMPYLRGLANKLSASLIETESREKHFTATEEPAILASVNPVVKVFTTRPDTVFGVTYLVLAPEHPWVSELLPYLENKADVSAYVDQASRATTIDRTDATKEKTGVELRGVRAINPANGEQVPVWIADYVLADYGTGAVMAVPAHDERDAVFAGKFNLPIRQVIEPKFVGDFGDAAIKPDLPFVRREAICAIVRNPENNTYLCVSWKSHKMNGLVTGGIEPGEDIVETARREILEETGYKNLRFVKQSPLAINTYFYHRIKQQNRHANFRFVFFELENGDREAVDEKEAAVHEIVWKKPAELKSFFTVFEGEFLLKLLANPNYAHTGDGLLVNSGQFTGQESVEARSKMAETFGQKVVRYKLRDWVFSRQRYWGEPIPLIHCDKCGVVAVPEKDLPVKLPKVKSYEPTGTGESPLASIDRWVNVKCPQCRGKAKRETNTMPQWAGSSWYYLRYMDAKNKKALVDPDKEKYWSPVDLYVGGAEHATRHLIYARFWHKFLQDIGAVSTPEPFAKLQSVGLIMGEDGRKMSKRFGNVVNPDEIVHTYGADTMRLYSMFMGPFDQQIAWSTASMIGSRRFIERVWKMGDVVKESVGGLSGAFGGREGVREAGASLAGDDTGPRRPPTDSAINRILHRAIKKVTEDIENLRFNTAISSLMIALNEIEKIGGLDKENFQTYLKLLAPFAPHVTEELWMILGNKKSIHIATWPTYDPALLEDSQITIMVQVNGKVRGSFVIPKGARKDDLEVSARALPEVNKWLEGKNIQKIVTVPDKLVNIVAI